MPPAVRVCTAWEEGHRDTAVGGGERRLQRGRWAVLRGAQRVGLRQDRRWSGF